MKKALYYFISAALAVMALTGCIETGTVSSMTCKVTYPDYATGTLVNLTLRKINTVPDNAQVEYVTDAQGHGSITGNTHIYFVTDGAWINLSGGIVDPLEDDGPGKAGVKYRGQLMTTGLIRLSGTGTYDPVSAKYSGDGEYIAWFNGGADIKGKGKWPMTSTVAYSSVLTIKINPGNCTYLHVVGGSVVSADIRPATLQITFPALKFSGV